MTDYKKQEDIKAIPEADRQTFQRGLTLFVIYITVYALFTLAGTIRKEILMIRVLGVNLGIAGGMTIIAGAIIIAVYYNWYATKVEGSQ